MIKNLITYEELENMFYCDEELGLLYWKKSKPGIRKDSIVGSIDHEGYIRTTLNKKNMVYIDYYINCIINVIL